MSDGLGEAAGARQTVSVVLPVLLDGEPDWDEGPLPFGTEQRSWDAERRRGYFAPAAARALYGQRRHRRMSVTEGPLVLEGLELLGGPTGAPATSTSSRRSRPARCTWTRCCWA
ncbi:hypothetical protein SGLAM104S_01132 [Streptomyces glaucescens]